MYYMEITRRSTRARSGFSPFIYAHKDVPSIHVMSCLLVVYQLQFRRKYIYGKMLVQRMKNILTKF